MSSPTSFHIAVMPGDGIGNEVMAVTLPVLDAVISAVGAKPLAYSHHLAGAQHYANTGVALADETMAAVSKADAILFGAMGMPSIRYPDGTEIAPQLDLRINLELYAGVRPIRTMPGLPSPLSSPRAKDINFVLIREQTEGLFYARGRGQMIEDRECRDTMLITRAGTERVSNFAFRLAERRQCQGHMGKVTCIDKANVFTSMAFMRRIFTEQAKKYPGITADYGYIDAMALNLVRAPWNYDVMVTENMYGDILSDLAAALVGGMGMAPSGDIGDRHGLFQPAHGSAPDIMGQGKANPTAMLLSAAMMLEWLGDRHQQTEFERAAKVMNRAITLAFASGTLLPIEFGGHNGTSAIAQAVTKNIPAALVE